MCSFVCSVLFAPVCLFATLTPRHPRAQVGMLMAGMLVAAADGGAMIERAGNKLLMYIELTVTALMEIIDELSRVLFQVIFGQGFPKTMLDTLETICGWTNFILEEIIGTSPDSGVLCKVFNWLSGAFEDLASMIYEIMNVSILGVKPFNTLLTGAHKGFKMIAFLLRNTLPCSPDSLVACDFAIEEQQNTAEVCAVYICILVGV